MQSPHRILLSPSTKLVWTRLLSAPRRWAVKVLRSALGKFSHKNLETGSTCLFNRLMNAFRSLMSPIENIMLLILLAVSHGNDRSVPRRNEAALVVPEPFPFTQP